MTRGAVALWTPVLLGCLSAGAGYPQALATGEVRQLTHDEWVDHHPVFSPSGDRILYTSRGDRSTGMFLVPVGGGERQRISIPPDVQGDFYTDWSPDGRSIVFDRRVGDGPGDVYLLRLGSGEMERLTDHPGMDGQPSFSPGGDRIVFTSSRGGSLDIWTMDVHGGDLKRLTDDPEADFHPRWSLDGTRILFTSRRGGDQDIWVMDADGRDQRRLTSLPGTEDRGFWSPDGSRIVFDWNDDLWLIHADGGAPERLTGFPGHEGNACWSRDGKLIGFVSDRSGSPDLWVLTLSGDGVPRAAGGDRRLRPVLRAGHVAGGGAGRAPAHDSFTPRDHILDVQEAIRTRRSVKHFTDRPVGREEVERLLDLAVQAPNHRMTQPWRFYVLGPEARRAYGEALGARKAKRVEDPEAAQAVVEKVSAAEAAIPATIAVTMTLDENPEIREEDYAATMMAVENLCLAAHATGLGTHIKSGAVMDDPRARAAVGVAEGERIVATIHLGEPAELPPPKPRHAAGEVTVWVP